MGVDRGGTKAEMPTRQVSPKNGNRKPAMENKEHPPLLSSPSEQFCGAVFRTKDSSYSIVERLGKGGMGTVYRAVDNRDGKTVAVKIISEEHLKKVENAVERFFTEIKAAMLIESQNVIKIIDFGTYKDNIFYVMEYLEGTNLKEMASQKDGRLPWELVGEIMMQVCDGMYAAHSQQPPIMHRDLSPDNIFIAITNDKIKVKVIDFGLAKFVQDFDDGLTKTGTVMGKPEYMAPEQVLKAYGRAVPRDVPSEILEALGPGRNYDHRVDIYATGVIMYRLLTGTPPFHGDTWLETMQMHLTTKPRKPREINPNISEDVEEIILRAMEKNPSKRYQTMRELKEAIQRCMPPSKTGPSVDFILSNILNTLDRSEEKAVKVVGGKPPSDAKTPFASAASAPYEGQKKRSGWFRRFMKWTATLSIIGSLSYGAYHFRHEIRREVDQYLNNIKTRFFDSEKIGAEPLPTQSPSPPAQQAVSTEEYLITVNSIPSGAVVQELVDGSKTGRRNYLGITPLQRRLPNGKHVLLVSKPGAGYEIVTVSNNQTTVTVTFPNRNSARSPRTSQSPNVVQTPVEAEEHTPQSPPAQNTAPSSEEMVREEESKE